ncbi:hypothetical protein Zmor_017330 [Zophobas morio]|uniref:Reverse transcriptase domain-containing protein n=1 Tax=Zophobas morio TaxID=2755281 RepID=A0AA38I8T0_9CUCU|nr:hypothetical protein Zmor_017330 [Zophobas morio]
MILDERLRKEMEARGMLPEVQTEFRKGRGTMDNVYILRHLGGREIRRKGGRMYALFTDFEAAFDGVNRKKMWEYLRRKGVDAYLVTKMEEIYEETVSKVRMNGIESESFYTNRGVRQGCPALLAVYLGNIDEMFRKAQTGGVVVSKEKVWSLAYADDLVIVAKKRKDVKTMIKSFEKYVQKKRNWKRMWKKNGGVWEESKKEEGRVGMERGED